MEYTIQKLGKMAGISTRTLRYYDEIGILKPARINSSGYRIYGKTEVDMLQQILFYKELGIELQTIKEIITSPSFDKKEALVNHRNKLLEKKQQIENLLVNVDKTLASYEGRITMTDKEKFTGFKKNLVEENERKYGMEAREKYGNDAVDKANKKFLNMTEEQYNEVQSINEELMKTLHEAKKTGNPAGELAQKAAELHKKWLCFYWDEYSKEAHANLTQMYVDDERFKAYYDVNEPGTAEFLRDAVFIYTGMKK